MKLDERVRSLPEDPGVYLFKDARGDILYVGKAVSLRNRVRSYFQSAKNLAARTLSMIEQARDVDFIVTTSEIEALILESNLIKKHRPKYNIRLRDDKHYPYLRVTVGDHWPRVLIARSMKNDGSRYFGPYTRSGAVNETLQLIRRIFPLRTCSDAVFKNVNRPCLNYHIKRCQAPCMGLVSEEEYAGMVKDVCTFLEGRPEALAGEVKERMNAYAERLEFEKAAKLRDQLKAIEEVTAKQKIISDRIQDRDVLGVFVHGKDAMGQILQIRRGKMIGAEQMALSGPENQSIEEVVRAVLTQYYLVASDVPQQIILPAAVEDEETVVDWLSELRGRRVRLLVASRGKNRELVAMATRNAELAMDEARPKAVRDRELAQQGAEELAEYLGLSEPPERLECYDISTIQGRHPVGSMVVFEQGMPNKDEYRRFRIKTVEGQDDFAMLAEMLTRRFRRGLRERESQSASGSSFAHFPDLIIIDGGKGQLNAALTALKELDLSIPTISIAEKDELIFRAGHALPLALPRDTQALMLVQRIRDEAHRSAVGYHRKVRSQDSKRSILDEIPGIGPKRRSELLKRFGSLKAIIEASEDDVAAVKGMNRPVARLVLDYLGARTGRSAGSSQSQ